MTRMRLATPIAFALAFVADADVAGAQPDLVVSDVKVRTCAQKLPDAKPYVVGEGCRIRVRARVKNRGDDFAARSRVAAGWVLHTSDGGASLVALGPGDAARVSLRGLVAPRTGTYVLRVCADAGDKVEEEREGNNCRRFRPRIRVRACQAINVNMGDSFRSFTEDSPPALLIPRARVKGKRLARATVRLRGGGLPGEQLSFVDQLGISGGTYNSGTGVLTLIGAGGAGTYAKALRSVWYENDGETPRNRTAVVRLTDRLGCQSKPFKRKIRIKRVNDRPRLGSGTGTRKYRAGGGPVVIDPFIAVLDPDSRIKSATVRITSGFVSNEDELALADRPGLTSNYNDSTGTLTIIGGAGGAGSLAFQRALRSITYENTASSSPSGPRTIEFRVTDTRGATSNVLLLKCDDGGSS